MKASLLVLSLLGLIPLGSPAVAAFSARSAPTRVVLSPFPPSLTVTAHFEEPSGNGRLDAFEAGVLVVRVENQGQGDAHEVEVDASVGTAVPGLAVDARHRLGRVTAGAAAEARVPVHGGKELPEGEVVFTLVGRELRGYDSNRLELVVSTSRLRAPALVIRDHAVDDGVTGLANGNGNGVPESGETVELVVFVENAGEGETVDAKLTAAGAVGLVWVRDAVTLGRVAPGETVKARLAFEVPRVFDGDEAQVEVRVVEARGVGGAQETLPLAVGKLASELRVTWRLLAAGAEVSAVPNGGEYDLEVAVANGGRLPARDVAVALEVGPGARLDPTRLAFGEVAAGGRSAARSVRLTLPRTYAQESLPLSLSVAQADFGPARREGVLPVAVRAPRLGLETQLSSQGGGNLLQVRESGAKLRTRVRNVGDLAALGVQLGVASPNQWLQLRSAASRPVGTVPPGGVSDWVEFPVEAIGRIEAGTLELTLTASQAEFPGLAERFPVTVVAEEITRIVAAAPAPERGPAPGVAASAGGSEIRVARPADGAVVADRDTIELVATVADAGALDEVWVEVNGRRLDLGGQAPAAARMEIRTAVPRREGENTVAVWARNAQYRKVSRILRVSRLADEDVETPPAGGTENPDAVAVVVGISRYENRDVPSVEYARKDAEAMRQYLIYTLGYREDRILTAYDEGASAIKLRTLVEVELPRLVKQSGASDVFVFYSGHGVPDTGNFQQYLLPYDASPTNLSVAGYPLEDLYRNLGTLKSRSVTVVLDACFSGLSERGPLVRGASPALLKVTDPALHLPNAVVLSASAKDEVANWYWDKGHGVFTYYFLMGLRGHADRDGDGRVLAGEMGEYLREKVPERALTVSGRVQTPQVAGNRDAVLREVRR